MEIESLIAILMENRLLKTEEEMSKFHAALNELMLIPPDENWLPNLFRVYSDAARNTPPLEVLLRYVKSFDKSAFVRTLVDITPELLESAAEWLRVFYIGTLADRVKPMYLRDLYAHLSSQHQAQIRQIFLTMAQTNYYDSAMEQALKEDIAYVVGESV